MRLKKIIGWLLTAKDNLKFWANKRKQFMEEIKLVEQDDFKQKTLVDKKIKSLKQSKGIELKVLTSGILQKADILLVQYVQRQHFSDILKSLGQNQNATKLPRSVQKLDPFLVEGVIRVGVRLDRADLPYDAKHPVLLPKDSCVSSLILRDSHNIVGHMGKNAMLADVRQRFWIIGGGTLAKQLVSKCVVCRRYRVKVKEQKMANLPTDRLTPDEPPFTRVGVDYFGPFMIKRGRSVVKRYGVVFTCLSIRAVHLEVACSLDTDSCINAIRRFIARRGCPKILRSDNGSNLVGCKKELQDELLRWNQQQLHAVCLLKNIQWIFNPPSGSHHGGVWERMIRSVRKVFYGLLQQQVIRLDDEGLQTLFCEVESILNGRPITDISSNPSDLSPLTPNHLLLLLSSAKVSSGIISCKRQLWEKTMETKFSISQIYSGNGGLENIFHYYKRDKNGFILTKTYV
ncbi:uncharacterized protein LOC121372258 [Gigantopelta aegis]|uniref:uncharacterized protein LOC121372258 n=1 Tax=Gigantopelta aegis TaxID=1735272 RepID=UPI001B88A915|nr:uncharacterized protein LOC121372258 [Gigantopelta aegis]